MAFEIQLTIFLNGLLLGGIYAMIALGLTMIFGISRVLNIAHGDFVTLSGAIVLLFVSFTQLPFFIALVFLIPIFLALGIMFEKGLINKVILRAKENMVAVSILVTLALSMIMEDTLFFSLGSLGLNYIGVRYFLPPVNIGSISLSSIRLILLISVAILALFLRFILINTNFGRALRAAIFDRELAESLGIDVKKLSTLSIAIGSMLAAIAGFFLVVITTITAFSGLQLTIVALTVVILGGLGSFLGALVGGLIIGVTESYTAFYIGTNWSPVITVLILIITLIIRPYGLFGRSVG